MPETSRLRILFAGTPEFAAVHLQALLHSQHDIVAVYTQPDRPAGRGKKLTPSPVKALAEQHQLPVLQPISLKSAESQAQLAQFQADVMIVVAYGLILPQAVLDAPRLGCINVHGSLLPRWRGAAPVQRAIEAGDAETGITIMQMDAGLDTGPMLAKASCAITDTDTSGSLFSKLETLGPPLLLSVLAQLIDGKVRPTTQDGSLANYAHKIDKAEADLDWSLPAHTLARKIRAFNPVPVAYTHSRNERIKIYRGSVIHQASSLNTEPHSTTPETKALETAPLGTPLPGTILEVDKNGLTIACGEQALLLQEIQLPGKKTMAPHAVLLGNAERFCVGDIFSRGAARDE